MGFVMDKRAVYGVWVALISLAAVVATFVFLAPIPQSVQYHQFADERNFLLVPHFWNVVSNLMFAVSGGLGFWALAQGKEALCPPELRLAYRLFFVGVTLVAAGSAYYHLAPDNVTLVWDRLPMTIAFMALFAIIIGEYIAPAAGARLLLPLLALGATAVVYWAYTERAGQGDLRAYLLVQFLPMLIIPLILVVFPARFGKSSAIWLLLACYLLAKVCEHFDAAIFQWGLGLSGHTLKHLVAALGVLNFALSLRHPVAEGGQ